MPNPSIDFYGEAPLGLEETGIDRQALRSSTILFTSDLAPSALLLMDETANKDDA